MSEQAYLSIRHLMYNNSIPTTSRQVYFTKQGQLTTFIIIFSVTPWRTAAFSG